MAPIRLFNSCCRSLCAACIALIGNCGNVARGFAVDHDATVGTGGGEEGFGIQRSFCNAHQELFNLSLQRTSGQLEKPSRIRELRRDIARANTFLRQQQTQKKEPAR